METLTAIFYAIILLCPIGLILIAMNLGFMGVAGAIGSAFYAMSVESNFIAGKVSGLVLSFLGQFYVNTAFTIMFISIFTKDTDSVQWPIWIAVFILSCSAPAYGSREEPQTETASHMTVPFVSFLSVPVFFAYVFVPEVFKPFFGWIMP